MTPVESITIEPLKECRHALELFTWRRFLPWVAIRTWREYRRGKCQACFKLSAALMAETSRRLTDCFLRETAATETGTSPEDWEVRALIKEEL